MGSPMSTTCRSARPRRLVRRRAIRVCSENGTTPSGRGDADRRGVGRNHHEGKDDTVTATCSGGPYEPTYSSKPDANHPSPGSSRVTAITLVAICLLFLAVSAPRISAPFGDSDEGIDGAVWATNSRALRDDGIVESRLGGRRSDGTSYATHPPYIVVSTAVAEAIGGEHEWATRIRLVGTSRPSPPLLPHPQNGASPLVAAAAAPPPRSLPWCSPTGSCSTRPWSLSLRHRSPHGLVSAVARAGGQVRMAPARHRRALSLRRPRGLAGRDPHRPRGVTLLGVASAGATRPGRRLAVPDRRRARRSALTVVDVVGVRRFRHARRQVLPPIGRVEHRGPRRHGVVPDPLALPTPRTRASSGSAVCCRALGPAIPTARGHEPRHRGRLRDHLPPGGRGHQYWNYWALIPTAVGFGWGFERLARDFRPRDRTGRSRSPASRSGSSTWSCSTTRPCATSTTAGKSPSSSSPTPCPPIRPQVFYIGQAYRPDAWLAYYTGRPADEITSGNDLAAMSPPESRHRGGRARVV